MSKNFRQMRFLETAKIILWSTFLKAIGQSYFFTRVVKTKTNKQKRVVKTKVATYFSPNPAKDRSSLSRYHYLWCVCVR